MQNVPKLPSMQQSCGRVGAWITLIGLIGFCFPLPIPLVILLFLRSLLNNTSKLTLLQLFQDLKKCPNTMICSISPVAVSFLWCICFYCWYLKKQLLSKSSYLLIDVLQEGESVVNEVNLFFLFQLLQASLFCPVTSRG